MNEKVERRGLMLDDDFPVLSERKPRKRRPKKMTVVQGKDFKAKGQIRRKKHRATRYPVYVGNKTDDATLERARWNLV